MSGGFATTKTKPKTNAPRAGDRGAPLCPCPPKRGGGGKDERSQKTCSNIKQPGFWRAFVSFRFVCVFVCCLLLLLSLFSSLSPSSSFLFLLSLSSVLSVVLSTLLLDSSPFAFCFPSSGSRGGVPSPPFRQPTNHANQPNPPPIASKGPKARADAVAAVVVAAVAAVAASSLGFVGPFSKHYFFFVASRVPSRKIFPNHAAAAAAPAACSLLINHSVCCS